MDGCDTKHFILHEKLTQQHNSLTDRVIRSSLFQHCATNITLLGNNHWLSPGGRGLDDFSGRLHGFLAERGRRIGCRQESIKVGIRLILP